MAELFLLKYKLMHAEQKNRLIKLVLQLIKRFFIRANLALKYSTFSYEQFFL